MTELNLEEIREQIDKCDNDLVNIISKRYDLVSQVIQYKIDKSMEIYQPQREVEVIQKLRNLANQKNINPDLIENIIKLIIEESKRVQKGILSSNQ